MPRADDILKEFEALPAAKFDPNAYVEEVRKKRQKEAEERARRMAAWVEERPFWQKAIDKITPGEQYREPPPDFVPTETAVSAPGFGDFRRAELSVDEPPPSRTSLKQGVLNAIRQALAGVLEGYQSWGGAREFQRLVEESGEIARRQGLESAVTTAPIYAIKPEQVVPPPETLGQTIARMAGRMAIEAIPIAGAYGTLGRAGTTLLRRLAPSAPKLVEEAVRGATAFGGYEALRSTAEGESVGEVAKSAAIGAGLGAAGDVAVSALGKAVRGLRNRRLSAKETPVEPAVLPEEAVAKEAPQKVEEPIVAPKIEEAPASKEIPAAEPIEVQAETPAATVIPKQGGYYRVVHKGREYEGTVTKIYRTKNGFVGAVLETPQGKKLSGIPVSKYAEWYPAERPAATVKVEPETRTSAIPEAETPVSWETPAKEPWQMTQEEYDEYQRQYVRQIRETPQYRKLVEYLRSKQEEKADTVKAIAELLYPKASTEMKSMLTDVINGLQTQTRIDYIISYARKRPGSKKELQPLLKRYKELVQEEHRINEKITKLLEMPSHEEVIKSAIAQNKPVPLEVLRKHPHLAEPWQLPREDYRRLYSGFLKSDREVLDNHRKAVEQALAEGKPVPQEVLKDYPDLAAKATPATGTAVMPEAEKPVTESPLKATIEKQNTEVRDVIEELKKPPVGMSVKAIPRAGGMAADAKVSDVSVEKVLSASALPRTVKERIKQALRNVEEAFKDVFVYEWRVAKYPKFQDELRRFQGVTKDARAWALKAVEGILGELAAEPRPNLAYEQFRKLVVLRDLEEALKHGEKVPLDLTLEQVQKSIAELEAKASPIVKKAIQKHEELMKAVWEELKARGKVDPSLAGRERYYPHHVLDYVMDLDQRIPAIAKRLKAPYRFYLQERKGSTKLIDTDYINVMMKHLAKIFIDNETDDFAMRIASEWDVWPKLSKEVKERIGELVPGRIYEINGQKYKAWQYDPGRRIYPASSTNEKAVLNALLTASTEGLSKEQAKELAKALTAKEVPAIGRYNETWLLPIEIAERLTRLKEPQMKSHIFEGMANLLRWWKQQVLTFAGVPFQVNNLLGDLINLYREDPRALFYLTEGWKAAKAWQKGEIPSQYRKLLELAEKYRVVEAGVMTRGGEPTSAILETFKGKESALKRYWEKYKEISERRELMPRLAKFIADMKRIEKGQMPVAKIADVKKLASAGMEPEQIAGKVAREFTVDYSKLTPEQKTVIRNLLMPFATFYMQNFQNWMSYVTKHPLDFLVKFGVPIGAIYLWNNTRFPEVEERLPKYYRLMPHLITGYKTEEGKPIIISFQTPVDLAARVIGLHATPDIARRYLKGEITLKEALKEQLATSAKAPVELAIDLANPFIKGAIEALANRSTFLERPIVSERLKGTDEEVKRKVKYYLEQVVAPYGQYVRATREPDPEAGLLGFLAKGPLDIKRALGYREVDLGREAINREYEAIEKATNADAQARYIYEQGYIQYKATGDISHLRKAEEQIKKLGVKLSEKQKQNIKENPIIKAEIVREQLKREKDPTVRRILQDKLKLYQKQQLEKKKKTVPKGSRSLLEEGEAND